MKSLSYRGRVALFLIALASVSLTGCQGLLGHSSNKIGVLSVSNASLGFGGTPVGKSVTLSEVLTNTGGSPTTISQASVSGAHFSLKGPALPTTIAPDQSVTFTVTFTPTAPGTATGTLVAVASDAADPTSNIPLSGSGLAQGTLSPSPSTLAFGNVQVGRDRKSVV